MNQTTSAGASLFAAPHPYLSKNISFLSIIISLILCTIGAICVFVTLEADKSSTMHMALLTIGTILVLCGIYRLFFRCKEIIYMATGSSITEGSCYFDISDLQKMSSLLEKKDFNGKAEILMKMRGNARMDYMISKDRKFAAVQLYHFIPYTYEAASRIFYFTDEDSEQFIHYIDSLNF